MGPKKNHLIYVSHRRGAEKKVSLGVIGMQEIAGSGGNKKPFIV